MSPRFTTMSLTLAGAAAAVAITASTAVAQKPTPKISKDSATVIARAQVPKGEIKSSEYEHEKGRWIYSFDIKVAGKSGVEEVNVDAMTGKVVAHEHEGAKAEAAEQKAEAKKKP